jgi:hypothetical protein
MPRLILFILLWPKLLLPSAVVGVHATAAVLTAFDIPEFAAVVKVSAVAAVPNAVHVPSAAGVSNVSGLPAVGGIPAVVGVRAVAGFFAMVNISTGSGVPAFARSPMFHLPLALMKVLLLLKPFFLFCQRPWSFCCGLSSALASLLLLTLLVSLQLLTSLLLQCFHRFWSPCCC